MASIILQGNITVDATDFDDTINSVVITGSRDSINKRATYGTEPSFAAGNVTWEVQIDHNQGLAAADLSQVFFDAMATVAGTITITASFQAGAVSATNPLFTFDALVTDFEIGGEVNTEGTASFTFPVLAAPVQTTT